MTHHSPYKQAHWAQYTHVPILSMKKPWKTQKEWSVKCLCIKNWTQRQPHKANGNFKLRRERMWMENLGSRKIYTSDDVVNIRYAIPFSFSPTTFNKIKINLNERQLKYVYGVESCNIGFYNINVPNVVPVTIDNLCYFRWCFILQK